MSIFDVFKKLEQEKTGTGPIEWLIVGLGNPGKKYETTRHNMGFMALDYMTNKLSVSVTRMKFKALLGEGNLGGKRVVFMKPQTFMNLSGEAVGACAEFYKLSPERIIVIYDDISLDVGKIRIREKGSAGGQNGMKSILYHLKTDIFPRIKIGVGAKPHGDYDLADWVLSSFTKEEQEGLEKTLERAYLATLEMVTNDIESAKQKYNG